jgi:hemolysin activation/secretion protein
LIGTSSVVQFELGHMPGADYGFNRYLIDTRNFVPLTHFLAFDSRVRFEATTGDLTQQKAEFIGGPGTLPGIYNKSIGGNRMILVNTEIRFNLAELSKVFGPDIQIVFNNDLGYVGLTSESSIVKGFEGLQFNTLAYNIGAALGFVSGIQIGASWRTDIKDTPRVVFRLERPF